MCMSITNFQKPITNSLFHCGSRIHLCFVLYKIYSIVKYTGIAVRNVSCHINTGTHTLYGITRQR